jgi:hypothetical protein
VHHALARCLRAGGKLVDYRRQWSTEKNVGA